MEKKAKLPWKNEKGSKGTIQTECTQWFIETLQRSRIERVWEKIYFKKHSKAELNAKKILKIQESNDE